MTQGQSGFNGNETPFTPDQLFDLFEAAMQNETLWDSTASGAVFLGSEQNILSLGSMDWSLSDVTAALPGDFDIDGDVDGRDFLTLQRTNPSLIGEWQGQYGNLIAVSNGGFVAAVPEPGSICLLGFAITVALLPGRTAFDHCRIMSNYQ
jgi:hypothetical protein